MGPVISSRWHTPLGFMVKEKTLREVSFYTTSPLGDDVKHVYNLGLGPCGRVVTRLECEEGPNGLTIYQYCNDDLPAKEFHYFPHLIKSKVTKTVTIEERMV